MKELNLIPCESLGALADRLNSDLMNGRALKFHNNGGVFVKDTEGKPLVHEYLAEGLVNSKDVPDEMSGWLFKPHTSYKLDGRFFREGTLGTLVKNKEFLKELKLNPSEPVLIYGSREEYVGAGINCFDISDVDSPEYGPISGIFRPSQIKGLFTFEKIERVYWKRAHVNPPGSLK